jgi:hypothetical protein
MVDFPQRHGFRLILCSIAVCSPCCSNMQVGLLEIKHHQASEVSIVTVKSFIDVRTYIGDIGCSLGPRYTVYFLEDHKTPTATKSVTKEGSGSSIRTFLYSFRQAKILAKVVEMNGLELGLAPEFSGIAAGREVRSLLRVPIDENRSYFFSFDPVNPDGSVFKISH